MKRAISVFLILAFIVGITNGMLFANQLAPSSENEETETIEATYIDSSNDTQNIVFDEALMNQLKGFLRIFFYDFIIRTPRSFDMHDIEMQTSAIGELAAFGFEDSYDAIRQGIMTGNEFATMGSDYIYIIDPEKLMIVANLVFNVTEEALLQFESEFGGPQEYYAISYENGMFYNKGLAHGGMKPVHSIEILDIKENENNYYNISIEDICTSMRIVPKFTNGQMDEDVFEQIDYTANYDIEIELKDYKGTSIISLHSGDLVDLVDYSIEAEQNVDTEDIW